MFYLLLEILLKGSQIKSNKTEPFLIGTLSVVVFFVEPFERVHIFTSVEKLSEIGYVHS